MTAVLRLIVDVAARMLAHFVDDLHVNVHNYRSVILLGLGGSVAMLLAAILFRHRLGTVCLGAFGTAVAFAMVYAVWKSTMRIVAALSPQRARNSAPRVADFEDDARANVHDYRNAILLGLGGSVALLLTTVLFGKHLNTMFLVALGTVVGLAMAYAIWQSTVRIIAVFSPQRARNPRR